MARGLLHFVGFVFFSGGFFVLKSKAIRKVDRIRNFRLEAGDHELDTSESDSVECCSMGAYPESHFSTCGVKFSLNASKSDIRSP